MTKSKDIKIIDNLINEERRALKANLEGLKDNIIEMLEEFDELNGYSLYKKWEYSPNLPRLIQSRTAAIMDLDLVKYSIINQEEE